MGNRRGKTNKRQNFDVMALSSKIVHDTMAVMIINE
jgi:hypothetical protein